jgi:hypothetical protein
MQSAQNGGTIYRIYAFSSKIKISMNSTNDNLIKAPVTPYGDQTVKIEYAGYKKSAGETFTLFLFFGFLILPNVIMLVTVISMRDRLTVEEGYNPWEMLSGYIPTMVFAAILIGLHIYFRKKRLKKLATIQEVIAKGQMVIGDIMNLETVTTGSGDDRTTNYYYHVKYKKPGSDDEVQFDTPYLASHPQIRNEEFPLKVKVYIGDGSFSYADEIINPPIEKIKSRKQLRALLVTVLLILAVGGIFTMAINTIIGGIMFGTAMVIAVVINILDRK